VHVPCSQGWVVCTGRGLYVVRVGSGRPCPLEHPITAAAVVCVLKLSGGGTAGTYEYVVTYSYVQSTLLDSDSWLQIFVLHRLQLYGYRGDRLKQSD
jgi:hypothetical protein